MVAAEEDVPAEPRLRAVTEARQRPWDRDLGGRQRPQRAVPGERSERQDDAKLGQPGQFAGEEGQAAVPLLGKWPVGRWRAADHSRDVDAVERQAVVTAGRRGLARESRAVQGGEEEVARAIAGEDPAGAIAAMSGRGETDHEDPGRRIAEARDGPAPVRFVGKPGHLLAGDALAPLHQPWAAAAGDDLLGQGFERFGWHRSRS